MRGNSSKFRRGNAIQILKYTLKQRLRVIGLIHQTLNQFVRGVYVSGHEFIHVWPGRLKSTWKHVVKYRSNRRSSSTLPGQEVHLLTEALQQKSWNLLYVHVNTDKYDGRVGAAAVASRPSHGISCGVKMKSGQLPSGKKKTFRLWNGSNRCKDFTRSKRHTGNIDYQKSSEQLEGVEEDMCNVSRRAADRSAWPLASFICSWSPECGRVYCTRTDLWTHTNTTHLLHPIRFMSSILNEESSLRWT